jgi:hypothetical protein
MRQKDGMTEKWSSLAIFLFYDVSVSRGGSCDSGMGAARAGRGQVDSDGRAECDSG